MKYFNHTETMEELKAEYRRLALENHPDRGGNVEVMQEINAEFDLAYRIVEKKSPRQNSDSDNETPTDYKREFYTANGWAGSRFKPGVSLKDIAPIIRSYVKDVYPTWKFSITRENYNGFYVYLMEAPAEIFSEEGIRKWAREEIWKRRRHGTEADVIAYCKAQVSEGYLQNWDWYYDYMTERAREVLSDIEKLVNSYRFDDSDARFDYFNTNFYPHFYIGKYGKPFKIVAKKERIQTSQGPEGAKRLPA
jgi:hypothetical protein